MWRLAGGSTEFEGHLEFKYMDGKWGSVCSANFKLPNIRQICHELGYKSLVTWYDYATPLYGSGDGPVYYFPDFRAKKLLLTRHCPTNNILSLRCYSGKNNYIKINTVLQIIDILRMVTYSSAIFSDIINTTFV